MTEINKQFRNVNANKAIDFSQAKFEVKALDFESRKISGYAAVFGNKDEAGDVLISGCFAKSIYEAGPNSSTYRKIAFVSQHDIKKPLGKITLLKEDSYGLYFEAEISKTQLGDELLTQLEDGTINQFSIGFRYIIDKCTWDSATETFFVKEVMLIEISAVTLGCNALTHFTGFKNAFDFDAEQKKLHKAYKEFEKTLTEEQKQKFTEINNKSIALATHFEPRKHSQNNEPQLNLSELSNLLKSKKFI